MEWVLLVKARWILHLLLQGLNMEIGVICRVRCLIMIVRFIIGASIVNTRRRVEVTLLRRLWACLYRQSFRLLWWRMVRLFVRIPTTRYVLFSGWISLVRTRRTRMRNLVRRVMNGKICRMSRCPGDRPFRSRSTFSTNSLILRLISRLTALVRLMGMRRVALLLAPLLTCVVRR